MWITRKFSSNGKLTISMSLNISLGLFPQCIAVKVARFFDKSKDFSEKVFLNT